MRVCPSCGTEYQEGEQFCPFDASRLEDVLAATLAPPDPLIGAIIAGRYRILSEIGSGGMGKIYEAEHVTLRKPCAIKILRDSEAANPEMVQRFRQEAESASRIGHPGIVTVHDFGVTEAGANYMVMELLTGRDLSVVLKEQGPMAPQRAVSLLLQATDALEAAHRAGIVHRDLKPENLFLTLDEHGYELLKIVDFGLAKMSDLERTRGPGQKLTRTGMIFGTPKYMSPEQCQGKPADARSDVYALGVIAYEMLVGVPPFDADTFLGVLHMHTNEPVPPMRAKNPRVAVPELLESVVLSAMSKDPSYRPPSMEIFGEALRSAVGPVLQQAPVSGFERVPHTPSTAPGPGSHRPGPASQPPGSQAAVFAPPSASHPLGSGPATFTAQPTGVRRESTESKKLRISHQDLEERPLRSASSRGPERFVVPFVLLLVAGLAAAAYLLFR
ncbi:MAG: serine/threonine-protein kinase [Polyangiales bacterium]